MLIIGFRWIANQKKSPFLRLPAEIRNKIYTLSLGGNTINIGYETYRTTYEEDKPQMVEPIFKYRCTVYNATTNPFRKPPLPYINVSSTFTPLNMICRQLYLETAASPYELNTLSFGSNQIMLNFLLLERRLSRQQLDAIKQIILPDGLPQPNMLAYLRNLNKVYLGLDQVNGDGRVVLAKGWYRVIREEGHKPRLIASRLAR